LDKPLILISAEEKEKLSSSGLLFGKKKRTARGEGEVQRVQVFSSEEAVKGKKENCSECQGLLFGPRRGLEREGEREEIDFFIRRTISGE